MRTQIFASNIKCGGCTSKIKEDLEKIEGVELVDVSIETGEVLINYQGEQDKRAYFASRLELIGHPEKKVESQSSPFEF